MSCEETADRAHPGPTSSPPAPAVKVRMYRQGLGDCFLLRFERGTGERPFHVMIDCGVLLGTPNAQETMLEVVANVRETTGGRVDLLVVTHEHYDHVSGFLQAAELFDPAAPEGTRLAVDRLWLAWTEDPANPLAQQLRGERTHQRMALGKASHALRVRAAALSRDAALGAGDGLAAAKLEATADRVGELLGFFGAAGSSTEEAMQVVQTYAPSPATYCYPSRPPIVLPELPGVRFFVLGPPENERLIKKSDPSRRNSEVYEAPDPAHAFTFENAFFGAALPVGPEPEDAAAHELTFPFDKHHRIPVGQAKQQRFFQHHYFGPDQDSDFPDQSWRTVESDWFGVAEALALKLDSDTNNTSLALAIELTGSGRVLLFPGDAQVGNWLSWSDLSWDLDGKTVTMDELFRRTVLYKVGHHASHNATLREAGLEKMSSDELVALIPVNAEMAKKKRWTMPFPPLYQRLLEKTRGRTIRADGVPPENPVPAQWLAHQKVTEDALYFEVSVG